MTFSRDVIALAFYFSCTHKNTTGQVSHSHTHGIDHICEQLGFKISKAGVNTGSPFHISIQHFICKLHVSCYLWWGSGELCDVSSFSLIITVMRIKVSKLALLVGFPHPYAWGRENQSLAMLSFLLHWEIREIRCDLINICDGLSYHKLSGRDWSRQYDIMR